MATGRYAFFGSALMSHLRRFRYGSRVAAVCVLALAAGGCGITESCEPLAIATTSLGNGITGVDYSVLLEISGGQWPFSFAITSGALPDGLSLNQSSGRISGAPTELGTFDFSVAVSDSCPGETQTANVQLAIMITAPAQLAWSYKIPGGTFSSPNYADLDGDGDYEIIVGGSDAKVYAFRSNGDLAKGWPFKTKSYIYAAPAVGDLNNDAKPEIVVASNDGYLYALSANGALLPGWPRLVDWTNPATGGAHSTGSPILADLDEDRALDIIYASSKFSKVFAMNHSGQSLPGWPKSFETIGEFTFHTPIAGDIDKDGSPEIACGVLYTDDHNVNYNKLYIWNHDGTNMTGWPRKFEDYYWSPFSSLAYADINNDTAMEIIFSDILNIYVTTTAGRSSRGGLKTSAGP